MILNELLSIILEVGHQCQDHKPICYKKNKIFHDQPTFRDLSESPAVHVLNVNIEQYCPSCARLKKVRSPE